MFRNRRRRPRPSRPRVRRRATTPEKLELKRRLLLLSGAMLGALLLSACGGDASSGSAMNVVRDSVGDTLIVRTVDGSTWGDTDVRLVPEVSVGVLDGPVEQIFGNIDHVRHGTFTGQWREVAMQCTHEVD